MSGVLAASARSVNSASALGALPVFRNKVDAHPFAAFQIAKGKTLILSLQIASDRIGFG